MQCITPYHVRKKSTWYGKDDSELIPVPCGKCPMCIERRTSGWSFRLMLEGKRSSSAHFITLTYNTDHVEIKGGYMTLVKRDVQLFMKRLRKLNHQRLRYYVAGEYGEKNWRPHYHMLLFNADIATVAPSWFAPPRGEAKLPPSPIGDIHYGEVTGGSIGYTLKYMAKPSRIPVHANDQRIKEFSMMSKGIGSNYLTDAMIQWHHAKLEDRMYCVLEDGRKLSMPRYFKNKVYTDDQREIVANAQALRSSLLRDQFEADMWNKYKDDWQRVKVEKDIASFKKMYQNAIKNRHV